MVLVVSKLYGVNATIVIFVFVLYCFVFYCIVLYYIVLYCTVLYCTVSYCIVFYSIVLCYICSETAAIKTQTTLQNFQTTQPNPHRAVWKARNWEGCAVVCCETGGVERSRWSFRGRGSQ